MDKEIASDIIKALGAFSLGILTYFGINRNAKTADEAVDVKATEVKGDKAREAGDSTWSHVMQLQKRMDEVERDLRARLKQNEIDSERRQKEAEAEHKEENDRLFARIAVLENTVAKMGKLLEKRDEENSRLRAENDELKNGGTYKKATL